MFIDKKLELYNKINFGAIEFYLNKIKESYQNIYYNFFKNCIFPKKIYKEIIGTVKIINYKLNNEKEENMKKEWETLSNQLFCFSGKIKQSSYENDILNGIKELNGEIKNFTKEIDSYIVNDSKNDEMVLYGIEEEEKYINKFSNFSFIKELNLNYQKCNEDKNLENSLSCINYSSKSYNDNKKSNIDYMEFPILKIFDEIHSNTEFFSEINNFSNIGINSEEKIQSSEYVNKFDLDISSIKNKEEKDILDNYPSQADNFLLFHINMGTVIIFSRSISSNKTKLEKALFNAMIEKLSIIKKSSEDIQTLNQNYRKCFKFLNELNRYKKCNFENYKRNKVKNKKVLSIYVTKYKTPKKQKYKS